MVLFSNNAVNTSLLGQSGTGSFVGSVNPIIDQITYTTSNPMFDGNGNQMLGIASQSSAVNYIVIENAATGNNPTLTVGGSDSTCTLKLASKGTGPVNIQGLQNGSTVSTGYVGEFIYHTVPAVSGVAVTSGVAADMWYFELTAGDWDVWANLTITNTTNDINSTCIAWISTTSATVPDPALYNVFLPNSATYSLVTLNAPYFRANITSPTNIYLSGVANFSSGITRFSGSLFARRAA
jgi:hypothetical protein